LPLAQLCTSSKWGAALLLGGFIAGLYLAAIAMITLLAVMISGAWLLIRGISERGPRPGKAKGDAS